MVANFFSCQPLPAGNANGIVTALKRSMAAAGVYLFPRWPGNTFGICKLCPSPYPTRGPLGVGQKAVPFCKNDC